MPLGKCFGGCLLIQISQRLLKIYYGMAVGIEYWIRPRTSFHQVIERIKWAITKWELQHRFQRFSLEFKNWTRKSPLTSGSGRLQKPFQMQMTSCWGRGSAQGYQISFFVVIFLYERMREIILFLLTITVSLACRLVPGIQDVLYTYLMNIRMIICL